MNDQHNDEMATISDETGLDLSGDFGTPEDAAEFDAALAAPGRPPGARKSRAGLLAGVALLAIGGAAGGYYYLVSAAQDGFAPPPAQAQAPDMPAPPAFAPEDAPVAPDPGNTAAAEPEDPFAMQDQDPLFAPDAPGAEDPLSVPPEDDLAFGDGLSMPAPPVDEDGMAAADVAVPPDAPVQESVEEAPAQDDAPFPDDAAPDLMEPPLAGDAADIMALPPEEAPSPADTSAMTPATDDTMPPQEDLPPPAEEDIMAAPPATENMSVPEEHMEQTQQVPAPSPSDLMTEAERAIIENAPVLDQMTAAQRNIVPVPDPQDLGVQDALIRPLPQQYLVVKRNATPETADARLAAARAALAQGRYQAALELFSELERDTPGDTRVLMGRAVSLQRLGMQDAALAAYEDVLTRDPTHLEALTNMLGLLKAQDPGLALDKLRELRETYPANADITAQLGIAYGAAGQYAQAIKYLDIADALSPGNAYVTYNKAVVYDRMGNATQAALHYRQILILAADGRLEQPLPLDAIRSRLAVLR